MRGGERCAKGRTPSVDLDSNMNLHQGHGCRVQLPARPGQGCKLKLLIKRPRETGNSGQDSQRQAGRGLQLLGIQQQKGGETCWVYLYTTIKGGGIYVTSGLGGETWERRRAKGRPAANKNEQRKRHTNQSMTWTRRG